MTNTGGKGSKQRPNQTSAEQFSNSWDTIFGKKTKNASCGGECDKCIKNDEQNNLLNIEEPNLES